MTNSKPYIPDEENPDLIFNSTDSSLLLDAAQGRIDLKALAIKELENRGLDPTTGAWRGFTKKTIYLISITE